MADGFRITKRTVIVSRRWWAFNVQNLGRKPTARAKASEALELDREGKTPTEIAKALGIGRASVYRILESVNAKGGIPT